ncbi:MAG: BamA/TamA family outer membrane protein [Bacteroidales bacterium]|jgi:outer membrane protein assembly factor BamA|nr:BamA/TamA family outer membrane protein [Bacteroidales bacterium]
MRKSYRLIFFFVIIIGVVFFTSCSPYKHISKDGLLLSKNQIKTNTKEFSKSELENLIIQDPNTNVFGMKMGMYFYSLSPAGEDSVMNWFSKKIFRSWGDKPAQWDENLTFQSKQNIAQYLKTKGSFGATIIDTIKHKRKWYAPWSRYKRRIVVEYIVSATERYKINEFEIAASDSIMLPQVKQIMQTSDIKKGAVYDEDILTAERERLVKNLKERGYFAFEEKYVTYQIDTNKGNNSLDIKLLVSNPVWQRGDTIREGHHKVYTVRNIYVHPNYISGSDIEADTSIVYHKHTKQSSATRFLFIHNNDMPIKTKPLLRSMLFQRDSVYSPLTVKRTYDALSQLRNFKYIDIKPLEVRDVDWRKDTLPVDFDLRLSMATPVSFVTGVELTYSQTNAAVVTETTPSNFGLEYNLGLQHTNLFKGAEIFSFNTKVAAEVRSDIFSKSHDMAFWSYFGAFEVGADVGVEIPRFLVPFATKLYSMQFRPHTTIRAGFNYQKRRDFERSIFNLTYGYTWITSEKTSHSFFPVEINFVNMDITSTDYGDLIRNWSRRMKYQVSDHLVMDMRYSYMYNGQSRNSRTSYHYFRFNAEASGNVLYAASRLSKSVEDSLSQYRILNIPFSQYVRSDVDFAKYIFPSKRQTLVIRGYFGIGLSYGNSRVLPYEKNFFGGGPNNLRAWGLRELGPGSAAADTADNMERSGDISLGGNVEYRFPLFGFVEGAAFFDFGNVWLMRPQSDLEGGVFEFSDFYKEFAADLGLGVRLNVKILILRFDFAVKVFDPSQPLNSRFVLPHTKFRDIVLQFGLNYPF